MLVEFQLITYLPSVYRLLWCHALCDKKGMQPIEIRAVTVWANMTHWVPLMVRHIANCYTRLLTLLSFLWGAGPKQNSTGKEGQLIKSWKNNWDLTTASLITLLLSLHLEFLIGLIIDLLQFIITITISQQLNSTVMSIAFSALTLWWVGHQEEHPVRKTWVMRCWCGCLEQGANYLQISPPNFTISKSPWSIRDAFAEHVKLNLSAD